MSTSWVKLKIDGNKWVNKDDGSWIMSYDRPDIFKHINGKTYHGMYHDSVSASTGSISAYTHEELIETIKGIMKRHDLRYHNDTVASIKNLKPIQASLYREVDGVKFVMTTLFHSKKSATDFEEKVKKVIPSIRCRLIPKVVDNKHCYALYVKK